MSEDQSAKTVTDLEHSLSFLVPTASDVEMKMPTSLGCAKAGQ